jgi:hypothetical protein
VTDAEIQRTLKALIEFYGPVMDTWLPAKVSGVQLLGAIAHNESSFGLNRVSKHENSWDYTGPYFQKDLWERWGSDASCSRGSFQLMYPIAVKEYGLSPLTPPAMLDDDHLCIFYMVKYVQKKLTLGADTVEKLLDAYNSGTHKDLQTDKVKSYVARGLKAYFEVRMLYGLTGGKTIIQT